MTPRTTSESVLEVGALPGRRRKALMVRTGSVIYPVAYFRDDAAYERFKAATKGAARLVWEDERE